MNAADTLDLMGRLAERTRQFEQSQANLADALRRLDEIRKIYGWHPDEPQSIGLTEAEWIKRSRETLARQRDDAIGEVHRLNGEIEKANEFMRQDQEKLQKLTSELEAANARMKRELDEYRREANDWQFMPDEFGGHMLCRSTNEKWYPANYFKRPRVPTPLKPWNGVDASDRVEGWVRQLRVDDADPGIRYIHTGDTMVMVNTYSGKREFFHLVVVGTLTEDI